jgi:hypothetical protein
VRSLSLDFAVSKIRKKEKRRREKGREEGSRGIEGD